MSMYVHGASSAGSSCDYIAFFNVGGSAEFNCIPKRDAFIVHIYASSEVDNQLNDLLMWRLTTKCFPICEGTKYFPLYGK